MEAGLVALAEKSIIGAAFLMLLMYFINKHSKTQENIVAGQADISKHLIAFGNTLKDISYTLSSMDNRMEKLERRVEHLEGDKRYE